MAGSTNEWEFQGEALGWIKTYIDTHPIGLDTATQEFKNSDGKRSDVVVWKDHPGRVAVLAMELKTPSTKLSDVTFQKDAVRKARKVGSDYVALWNMQSLSLYRTPARPRQTLLPHDLILGWDPDPDISKVSDWVKQATKDRLRQRANALMSELFDLLTNGTVRRIVVDATIFVSALTERIRLLRLQIEADVNASLAASAKLRRSIYSWQTSKGSGTWSAISTPQ